MGHFLLFQKLFQKETRKLVTVMGILATIVILVWPFMLLEGNPFSALYPAVKAAMVAQGSFTTEGSSPKSTMVNNLPYSSNLTNTTDPSTVPRELETTQVSNTGVKTVHDNTTEERDTGDDFELDEETEDNFELDEDKETDNGFSDEEVINATDESAEEKVIQHDSTLENPRQNEDGLSPWKPGKPDDKFALDVVRRSDNFSVVKNVASPDNDQVFPPAMGSEVPGRFDVISGESSVSAESNGSVRSKQAAVMLDSREKFGLPQSGSATSRKSSRIATFPVVEPRKRQITISQMNNILLQNWASRPVKPHWSSASDKELLTLKRQIENAPIVRNDRELDGLVFRNLSMFKMSYMLMERRLKVYVYKEGETPIFHKPLLKGIYASEGWFMKLLEGNRKFVVNQPQKAHLFYLPFCSTILRIVLYKPKLHNWKKLQEFLKNYVDGIATKYPFWNRTDGSDHFLAACHDLAPTVTGDRMQRSIRALCNADLSKGFKLGKDVSLPATNVRSGQKPLIDLGGKPASKRTTLAFYAGHLHGRFREILLRYWENKDPDMKIMGPIRRGGDGRKNTYIQHMKNSKYCICPRGYQVYSPRVVEAIFYECVPVIMSDNYVPPFFEILSWETFAVFVAEKDIPMLKDILLSIPEERYLIMQERVKKVQQHFLWHSKPVKYDIFHMILHSIWFYRLNQVQVE